VAVLFAPGSAGVARAAKAATSTIPIVFANGGDPVKVGLVASLNRPGGNATGFSFYTSALAPKRLELLLELMPRAQMTAFLVNPTNPVAEGDIQDMEDAARSVGQQITVVRAKNEAEIDAAFATIAQQRAGALLVDVDAYFSDRRDQLVELAARYRIPASYNNRQYVVAGGLLSYGPNLNDAIRQAGVYVGRILKGEKPADLPVMQPTKFELVINLNTAKVLGLTIPDKLIAVADDVIE
jgi:putative ABC transport system substrate-binding protein